MRSSAIGYAHPVPDDTHTIIAGLCANSFWDEAIRKKFFNPGATIPDRSGETTTNPSALVSFSRMGCNICCDISLSEFRRSSDHNGNFVSNRLIISAVHHLSSSLVSINNDVL